MCIERKRDFETFLRYWAKKR